MAHWARLALLAPLACTLACAPPDAPVEAEAEVDPNPAYDFDRSPYTGWTREHYVALFGRMLDGWSDHLSPGGARGRIPGEGDAEHLEGVTRMLPVFGAWLSNPSNPRVLTYGGREHDVLAYARNILLRGTDPEHEEYWGPIDPPTSQARVEAAFVAEFLVQTRDVFWDELTDEERERIMTWLRPSSAQYGNNWQLFAAVGDATRHALGYPIDAEVHEARLAEFETHYLGDGWYRDGEEDELDGYNGFVIHAEWLWWAHIAGDEDPGRRDRVVQRAQAWLHHLPWLLSPDGATPPIGRSRIYRSAWLAPLVLATRFDQSPLEPGVARRILSSNLAWHLGDGPLASDRMFDENNLLRMGYVGEDPNATEAYQKPGAQYLVSRALGVLALPEDHEFWTATEAALPADGGDFVHAIPSAGFHLSHHDGIVVLDNARGFKRFPSHQPRQAKLAYASHLPFTITSPAHAAAVDAMVLPTVDSENFAARLPSQDVEVVAGYAGMRYFTFGPSGIVPDEPLGWADEVRTAVVTYDSGRVRLTCVSPSADAPVWFHEGTFSTSADLVHADVDPSGRWAYAETQEASVALGVLFGYEAPGEPAPWQGGDGRNMVHERDAVITVRSSEQAGSGSTCAASVHMAGRGGFDPDVSMGDIVEWSVEDDALLLELSGSARVWANVERLPAQRDMTLGSASFSGPLRYARASDELRAAAGVLTVQGDGFPSFASDAGATTYTCAIEEAFVSCELGGPGSLGTPDGSPSSAWTIELVHLDGSLELFPGDASPTIDLDQTRFDTFVSQNASSTLRLRLHQ